MSPFVGGESCTSPRYCAFIFFFPSTRYSVTLSLCVRETDSRAGLSSLTAEVKKEGIEIKWKKILFLVSFSLVSNQFTSNCNLIEFMYCLLPINIVQKSWMQSCWVTNFLIIFKVVLASTCPGFLKVTQSLLVFNSPSAQKLTTSTVSRSLSRFLSLTCLRMKWWAWSLLSGINAVFKLISTTTIPCQRAAEWFLVYMKWERLAGGFRTKCKLIHSCAVI